MTYCKKCGKNHATLEGYIYSTLVKKHLYLNTCIDNISVFSNNWRMFVNAIFFNNTYLKWCVKIELKKTLPYLNKIWKLY
jgi:hypothetical protein